MTDNSKALSELVLVYGDVLDVAMDMQTMLCNFLEGDVAVPPKKTLKLIELQKAVTAFLEDEK